jgi:hypothetical protein
MFQWSEAHVAFGNCSLLMNGSWMWGEKTEPLEILAQGRVDLKNVFNLFQSKLFPEEMRLKVKRFQGIAGGGELSFKSHSIKGMQSILLRRRIHSQGCFSAAEGGFYSHDDEGRIFVFFESWNWVFKNEDSIREFLSTFGWIRAG